MFFATYFAASEDREQLVMSTLYSLFHQGEELCKSVEKSVYEHLSGRGKLLKNSPGDT